MHVLVVVYCPPLITCIFKSNRGGSQVGRSSHHERDPTAPSAENLPLALLAAFRARPPLSLLSSEEFFA